MPEVHAQRATREMRFKFGKNWTEFLHNVGEVQIAEAERSFKESLHIESLAGRTFLDIGSGSGLFSLAAMRLKAKRVYSFDYDPQSAACTQELKQRYFPADPHWVTEQGSALDEKYLQSLGRFDVVYAWGVLHHTGDMWRALDNAAVPVKKRGGILFISIYNDQGKLSQWWRKIKRTYNILPSSLRFLILYPVLIMQWGRTTLSDFLRGRPFRTWRTYSTKRGMSAWYDIVDWAGGYPFEVAKPEQIFDFYTSKGFELKRLKTMGGHSGCNEYVFMRK
jgi:2-polyprenyl-3-methyl-5-hydroxy-6-metoxy-1,4-benzoquinol methylase